MPFRWGRFSREYDVEDNETELRTNWKSIYIVALVAFIGSVHTNCINPAVWPYMKVLIPDVTEDFFGIISSLNGVGIVLSAPLAGWASNKLEDTTLPMLCAKVLAILSCVLYMLIEVIGVGSRRALFAVFELILGFSVGAAYTYRTHVAMGSIEADRPKAVAICSLTPSLGIFVGPLGQLAFTALGYPGVSLLFGMHLNLYTAPIYMVIVISLIGSLLLMFCFDGRMRLYKQLKAEKTAPESEASTSNLVSGDAADYDKVAFFICLYTKMLFNFCVIVFSSVGIPYAMTIFLWTSEKTVFYISICMVLVGLNICFWNSGYIFFDLRKRLSERCAIVIAFVAILIAYLITYPWPFLSERIPYQDLTDNSTEPLGCKREFAWCATTPRVNMWIYLGSLITVLGVAVPLSQINLDILVSKVLGNIKQGTLQSWMIICGDGLTIFLPMLFTKIYTISGPTYIWMSEIAILCVSLILWGVFYKRMVGKNEMLQARTKL